MTIEFSDERPRVAVLVGDKGNLGPIWEACLGEMGIMFHSFGLPGYDITCKDDRERMYTKCSANRPQPHIIIYNAAIDNPPGSDASFFGNIEKIIEVNLLGAVQAAELFCSMLQRNGGGTFITIGSILGNVAADHRNYPAGFEKPVGYNLSKAALQQLSKSITEKYGRYNIRAVTLAFGPVDTGKFSDDFKSKILANIPMGRFISEASLKATLRFAIDAQEFAGQTVLVDAGYCSC